MMLLFVCMSTWHFCCEFSWMLQQFSATVVTLWRHGKHGNKWAWKCDILEIIQLQEYPIPPLLVHVTKTKTITWRYLRSGIIDLLVSKQRKQISEEKKTKGWLQNVQLKKYKLELSVLGATWVRCLHGIIPGLSVNEPAMENSIKWVYLVFFLGI